MSQEDAPNPAQSNFYDKDMAVPVWEIGDVLQVRRDYSRKTDRPSQVVMVVGVVDAIREGGDVDDDGKEVKTTLYVVRDKTTGKEYLTYPDTLQSCPRLPHRPT